MKKHIGDLEITEECTLDITEVTGNLIIRKGAKLDAPSLTSVGGYLSIYSKAKLDALTSVGGDLYIYSKAKLDAPSLTSVGGYLSIHSEAKLDAPSLTSVGGYLSIHSEAKLDALTSVGGYLSIHSEAKLDALTSVGGDLYIYSQAKLDAPLLTSVGGYLYIHSKAKLDALTSVGDDLYIYSQAKLGAPKAKYNVAGTKEHCAELLRESFKKNGFVFADGILAERAGEEKTINGVSSLKIKVVGKTEHSYLVQRGNQFAHGETIEDAIKSLRYKLSDRDTSRFKAWKLSTKVSLDDAIQAYRAITGSCEYGTKAFCEARKIPAKLTVGDIIKMTDGQYGNDVFARFFN